MTNVNFSNLLVLEKSIKFFWFRFCMRFTWDVDNVAKRKNLFGLVWYSLWLVDRSREIIGDNTIPNQIPNNAKISSTSSSSSSYDFFCTFNRWMPDQMNEKKRRKNDKIISNIGKLKEKKINSPHCNNEPRTKITWCVLSFSSSYSVFHFVYSLYFQSMTWSKSFDERQSDLCWFDTLFGFSRFLFMDVSPNHSMRAIPSITMMRKDTQLLIVAEQFKTKENSNCDRLNGEWLGK